MRQRITHRQTIYPESFVLDRLTTREEEPHYGESQNEFWLKLYDREDIWAEELRPIDYAAYLWNEYNLETILAIETRRTIIHLCAFPAQLADILTRALLELPAHLDEEARGRAHPHPLTVPTLPPEVAEALIHYAAEMVAFERNWTAWINEHPTQDEDS